MKLKQKLITLQTVLNQFMVHEYGPDAWATLDNFEVDLLEEDNTLVTFAVRAGLDPEHNLIDTKIILPDEYGEILLDEDEDDRLGRVAAFLHGYLAALVDAAM